MTPAALEAIRERLAKEVAHGWITDTMAKKTADLLSHIDALREALEDCLREHGGYTIRGECERKARRALGDQP
jgi:hypothetical protein